MPTQSQAQHNKALMQEIFEAVGRGDTRLFTAHLAHDAKMTITGEYSWSQVFEGKEAIIELFRYVRSRLIERGRTHAFHFLADDDWVVIEARGDMTTLSGLPYRNHYCLLYRLKDDLIVEIKEYQDSVMGERLLGPCPPQLRATAPAHVAALANSRCEELESRSSAL